MSYLVLARKYRPSSFEEVSGQEHVTRTLAHAIERNQIAHAYLFAGPRGVGKTSIARIFARALNTTDNSKSTDTELNSKIATEIDQGISLAVREIDGASHNSVENVRELIDSFRSLPPPGYRFKVYIIDEVHMLSMAAFNALLKSLEEPPPNTVFILATTEAHKIPDTVISRCQRHDFRALSAGEIKNRLSQICEREQIPADDEALRMLARLSDGSMRDSQSLLERVRAFSESRISPEDVSLALGAVEGRVLLEISRAVFARQPALALEKLQQAFLSGLDTSIFLKEFVRHWREILLAKFADDQTLKEFGIPAEEVSELKELVAAASDFDVQDLVTLAREGADQALRSSQPRYALESLLVRLATRVPVKDIGQILSQLRKAVKVVPREYAAGSAPASPIAANTDSESDESRAKRSSTMPEQTLNADRWEAFVRFCGTRSVPLLFEQLKRLSAPVFTESRLSLRGPEFSIEYLRNPERLQSLKNLLQEFSSQPDWLIDFEVNTSNNRADEQSILQRSADQQRKQSDGQRKNLEEHPKVKELRKAFPGSTIESVRSK